LLPNITNAQQNLYFPKVCFIFYYGFVTMEADEGYSECSIAARKDPYRDGPIVPSPSKINLVCFAKTGRDSGRSFLNARGKMHTGADAGF
jgi:hypothetical protein